MSEVSNFIANQLKEMGFADEKIKKAMAATKATSVETAMEWLISHADDKMDDQDSSATDSETLKLRTSGEGGETEEEKVEEKPKTAEEIAEAKRRYEELIKQRRVEREEKEKQEELEREMSRRKAGSELVRIKEKMELDERMRAAEERRREKDEDKIHRAKIVEQIRIDREAFNLRNRAGKNSEVLPAPAPVASPVVASTPVSHDSCRLAIRLPDGSQLVNTFKAKETLAAVRLYIELNRKDKPLSPELPSAKFSLVMPPNQTFTEDDYERFLDDLGLCPSARLMVTQKK